MFGGGRGARTSLSPLDSALGSSVLVSLNMPSRSSTVICQALIISSMTSGSISGRELIIQLQQSMATWIVGRLNRLQQHTDSSCRIIRSKLLLEPWQLSLPVTDGMDFRWVRKAAALSMASLSSRCWPVWHARRISLVKLATIWTSPLLLHNPSTILLKKYWQLMSKEWVE